MKSTEITGMRKIKILTVIILSILLIQISTESSAVLSNKNTPVEKPIHSTSYQVENKTYSIVVSQPFIEDFVQNIVGNLYTVTSVVKGTQDPHSYTPTISDTLTISKANIFIYYGVADIDGWVTGIIPTLPASVHVIKLVNLSQDGLYDPYIGKGELNPHLWMWPAFVNSTLVQRIYNALVEYDPSNQQTFTTNLAHYRVELRGLIERVQGNATLLKGTEVVEYHAAYFYLLREMNVTRLGAVEQIEDQEPSAVHFTNISTVLKEAVASGRQVTIVQSMNIPADTSWQIARDTGANISYVAALIGNYQSVNFTSYIQMIDYDLVALTHPVPPPASTVPGFDISTLILPSIFILSIDLIRRRKNYKG